MTGEDDKDAGGATGHPLVLSRTARDAAVSPRPGGSPPVFLHASFRTGSTWLWQKLRSAPTTLAYYEIFHEILATLTPAQCKQIDFTTWDSRHPPSSPYLLEFLPLLEPPGGIAGFDQSMSFGSYIPSNGPGGQLSAAENAYVDRLISAARATERIPVLSCTRSLGRARALKQAVGGRTILLCRNLFHQWASYCWQAETKNSYFLDSIYKTIAGARHDPFLRNMSDWYGMQDSTLPPQELFEAFVVLHLYLYAFAFDVADLVVDVTEIASDRNVRRHVEDEISNMIQHEIDLSDVREHCEFTGMTIERPEKMRDTIEQFAKLIPTDSISSRALQFVETTKTRALAEWDRYEFFSRRTRSVLTRKIEDMQARLAERDALAEGITAERDRLSQELAETSAARQPERDALEAAAADERGALEKQIAGLEASRDDLQARLTELDAETNLFRAERDRLSQELTEASTTLQAAQNAHEAAIRTLAVERDTAMKASADAGTAHEAQIAGLEALRDDLQTRLSELDGIRADRDRLNRDLTEAAAARQNEQSAQQAAIRTLTAERDAALREVTELEDERAASLSYRARKLFSGRSPRPMRRPPC